MATAGPFFNPPSANDVSGYYRAIAAGRLGLQPSALDWYFFDPGVRGTTGMDFTQAGTSSRAYQPYSAGPPVSPASLLLTTPGAAGNSWNGRAGVSDGTNIPKSVKSGTTAKWAIFSQFALLDASAAGSITGVGCIDVGGTGFVFMGDNGATSTANFSARGNAGANIDSGRALDVNHHVHAIWRDGTTGYYQIDANAPVTGDIRPNADAGLAVTVQDSVANQHRLALVWWAIAVPVG